MRNCGSGHTGRRFNEARTSLEAFRDFDGPLRPHFAFGHLGKDKFARAHLMHIENHLEELRVM